MIAQGITNKKVNVFNVPMVERPRLDVSDHVSWWCSNVKHANQLDMVVFSQN